MHSVRVGSEVAVIRDERRSCKKEVSAVALGWKEENWKTNRELVLNLNPFLKSTVHDHSERRNMSHRVFSMVFLLGVSLQLVHSY